MLTIGSRAQVWNGNAKKTRGGLTKKDLFKKKGRIRSRRASKKAKRNQNLKKAGWTFKKGKFGAIRIEDKQTAKKTKGKAKKKGGARTGPDSEESWAKMKEELGTVKGAFDGTRQFGPGLAATEQRARAASRALADQRIAAENEAGAALTLRALMEQMEQMTEQPAAQRSGAAKMARSGGGVSALGGHRGGIDTKKLVKQKILDKLNRLVPSLGGLSEADILSVKGPLLKRLVGHGKEGKATVADGQPVSKILPLINQYRMLSGKAIISGSKKKGSKKKKAKKK